MAQIGMPVEYTPTANGGGNPASVSRIDGSGNVTAVFWPHGGTPQWQEALDVVRDDDLATNNSWRPVIYTGSVTVKSGV